MSDAQQPLNALPAGHRLQEYELERFTFARFNHGPHRLFAAHGMAPIQVICRNLERGDNLGY